MLKGFRDFIMRGNIVDLAIAVVIGVAFQKVVDSFVSAIVTPILNALPGGSVDGWGFSLRGGEYAAKTFVNISTIINALIVFLLTAAVVYFVFVVPMNKLAERRRGGPAEPEAPSEDIVLLQEIRDELRARR